MAKKGWEGSTVHVDYQEDAYRLFTGQPNLLELEEWGVLLECLHAATYPADSSQESKRLSDAAGRLYSKLTNVP